MNWGKWCAAACAAMGMALPAAGQSFRFAKILDGATQRPDGLGRFYINYGRAAPAFDGKWAAFRDPGPQNDDGSHAAIWTFNTEDRTFHKLAGFDTWVPGGATQFHDFQLQDTAPAVRNGVVIFLARDTAARQGLYSVPAGGGPIATVADRDTPDPSGGVFAVFDVAGKQMGGFSFDGTTVAFTAANGSQVPGVYSANADGSSLALVADKGAWTPAVSGTNVALMDSNRVYLGGAPVLDSQPPYTRFDMPLMAMDGNLVAFHATGGALAGLYALDLKSRQVTRIADANSNLPGLGKLQAVAPLGLAVNQGAVVFQATDATGASALYHWRGGAVRRIIGKGDLLDGRVVQAVADPGPGALSGAACVFVADFGADRGMFLATETLASVSAASFTPGGAVAPGAIVAGFGQALASGTEQAASLPLPMTLANTSVTLRDSAGADRPVPLFWVGPSQINYLVPEGAATGGATVTVTSGGEVTAAGVVNVEAVAPGLFTANASGAGLAAGQALSFAPDSTQSSAPLTAPIAMGTAGTRVFLVLYGTGIRGLTAASVSIGGVDAAVQYAGPQGAMAGLDQVNVEIPRALAGRGEVDVVLTVDGKAANTVKVNIGAGS
jgi:uncharacterized protein (TIGR03437 family)